MQFWPFVGLAVGVALRVLVPYVRSGLESVAESGAFTSWPIFDWRYLALFLLPLIEFGVAFLTVDGLWQAAFSWGFVPAVAMAYSGADIGRDVVGAVSAAYRIVRE